MVKPKFFAVNTQKAESRFAGINGESEAQVYVAKRLATETVEKLKVL
jgi:hypothetical protein